MEMEISGLQLLHIKIYFLDKKVFLNLVFLTYIILDNISNLLAC